MKSHFHFLLILFIYLEYFLTFVPPVTARSRHLLASLSTCPNDCDVVFALVLRSSEMRKLDFVTFYIVTVANSTICSSPLLFMPL